MVVLRGPAMRGLLICCGLLGLVACGRGGSETVTLYCYETLADSACYGAPDAGRGNRLLAVVEVPVTAEIALRLGLE
jgi:uncharacterized lipoprotein YmbA